MSKYIIQKKERIDEKGNSHINFNITIPPDVIKDMGLDSPDRKVRTVDLFYDAPTKTITIKKII